MTLAIEKINSRASLDRSPSKNWVERSGGLPMYIRRIANHLHQEKGMTIGHAVAVAVNAVKKMCGTGDLNWSGKQNVNAKSRAEACAAVASWERKKAGARVSKGIRGRKWSDDEFIEYLTGETPVLTEVHKGCGCEHDKKKKKGKKMSKVSKGGNPFWDGDGVQGRGQPRNHMGRWVKLPGSSNLDRVGVWEMDDGSFGVFKAEKGKKPRKPSKTFKTKRAALRDAAVEVEKDKSTGREAGIGRTGGSNAGPAMNEIRENAKKKQLGFDGGMARSQENTRRSSGNVPNTKPRKSSGNLPNTRRTGGGKKTPTAAQLFLRGQEAKDYNSLTTEQKGEYARIWGDPNSSRAGITHEGMMNSARSYNARDRQRAAEIIDAAQRDNRDDLYRRIAGETGRRKPSRVKQTATRHAREDAASDLARNRGKSLPGGSKAGEDAIIVGTSNKSMNNRRAQIVSYDPNSKRFTVQPIGRNGPSGRPVQVTEKMLSRQADTSGEEDETKIYELGIKKGVKVDFTYQGRSLSGTVSQVKAGGLVNITVGSMRYRVKARNISNIAKKFEELTDEEFAVAKSFLGDNPDAFDFSVQGNIEKRNDEKQMVFGWASVAKKADGTVVVDKQGDVLEDIDQMEKVAYDFVLHSRDGGEMHIRKGVSTLVESFVSTPEKCAAMGIPQGTLPVGWWVGFHVHDSKVWKGVKDGKYKMFSVHGSGLRKKLED